MPSLAPDSDSSSRSSSRARWRCTRNRSRPVAKDAPTSLSSRCRLASQPWRGCEEHSARKPQARPFSENAQASSERMPSSAKRAASVAASRRGADVSRISTMRRWSRPCASSGSRSSESPFITCGSKGANSAVALATRSMVLRSRSNSAMQMASTPAASRSASRLRLMQLSPPSLVRPWKSTATLVASTSSPTDGRLPLPKTTCVERKSVPS